MAKVTIEFDLQNEQDRLAHRRMISVDKTYLAMQKIAEELFKHRQSNGYGSEKHVQKCIDRAEKIGCVIDDFEIEDHVDDVVTSAISCLESSFYKILEGHGIDLEDLE